MLEWPTGALVTTAQLPDERLSYRLKTPWRNGTMHVIFEPLEFMARLAVLVPDPRVNMVRFHGVIGPAAKWRAAIVPECPEFEDNACGHEKDPGEKKKRPRNYAWASLMTRVFEIDVLPSQHASSIFRRHLSQNALYQSNGHSRIRQGMTKFMVFEFPMLFVSVTVMEPAIVP
jgi:hypothetical protein